MKTFALWNWSCAVRCLRVSDEGLLQMKGPAKVNSVVAYIEIKGYVWLEAVL